MLSRKEYLLLCLIEELGEVQKELSKVLRFTEDDQWSERTTTNKEMVDKEWSEVQALLFLLETEGFCLKVSDSEFNRKLERFEFYYDHSVKLKTVSKE